jgi:hypothetical protein
VIAVESAWQERRDRLLGEFSSVFFTRIVTRARASPTGFAWMLKVGRLPFWFSLFVEVDGVTAIRTDRPPDIVYGRIVRGNFLLVASIAECSFHGRES